MPLFIEPSSSLHQSLRKGQNCTFSRIAEINGHSELNSSLQSETKFCLYGCCVGNCCYPEHFSSMQNVDFSHHLRNSGGFVGCCRQSFLLMLDEAPKAESCHGDHCGVRVKGFLTTRAAPEFHLLPMPSVSVHRLHAICPRRTFPTLFSIRIPAHVASQLYTTLRRNIPAEPTR
ncbi:uncharacterized protein LOC112558915 isoform X3 [Pomacea canaliculata]|uniref:uncharacterized protein LOC112558915 isoform X3 n=1 Tax=Pomacea canaliculata TaxID=400727 RepID=UPI000D7347AB|nr:uncharacterized protein LOC112558915 isoform X3 [Pomacea canaliculata]